MENNDNIASKEIDKNEAISNLIQNIQSKLNNESFTSTEKINAKDISSNDINQEDNTSNIKDSHFDISSVITLLSKLNNNNENSDSGFNFDSLDPKLF